MMKKRLKNPKLVEFFSEGYVLRVRVGKLADMYTLVSSYIHTHIK